MCFLYGRLRGVCRWVTPSACGLVTSELPMSSSGNGSVDSDTLYFTVKHQPLCRCERSFAIIPTDLPIDPSLSYPQFLVPCIYAKSVSVSGLWVCWVPLVASAEALLGAALRVPSQASEGL